MAEQRLAIVGQAEASRRTVEQAHLEMLFQRRDLTGHRRLAGVRLPRDSRERAGLGHPDKRAQSADQVHDFPALRKDEFQESRIIFPRQEVYLRPSRYGTAPLTYPGDRSDPSSRRDSGSKPRRMTMKTMMLAAAAVLSLGVGSAFANEGDDGTGCQHLLHRVARRSRPGAEPAGAERGCPEPDGRRADRGLHHEPQLRDLAVPARTRATADQDCRKQMRKGAGRKAGPVFVQASTCRRRRCWRASR